MLAPQKIPILSRPEPDLLQIMTIIPDQTCSIAHNKLSSKHGSKQGSGVGKVVYNCTDRPWCDIGVLWVVLLGCHGETLGPRPHQEAGPRPAGCHSLSPRSLGSSLTYTVWRLVGVQPLQPLQPLH